MKRFLFGLMCLSSTAFATCDWPSVNHDNRNTRSNPCETILSPTTVANLVEVGVIASTTQVQVAPIIVNNVIYFGDTGGFVRAYDATTLTQIWEFNTGGSIDAPVTYSNGIIYATNVNINLYALDATTGALQTGWPVVVDPNNAISADILAAPVVVDNIVIVATVDGSPPAFGTDANPSRHQSISAFNATSGKFIWRRVIQPPPLGAQGGSFSTAAVDTKLHLMFIGTSNSDDHPVGNQTDALLALDYRTGKRVWSRQYTKCDSWGALYPVDPDADVGASPNLFHIKRKGKRIPVVGVASKKGDYRVWKRKNGKPVWHVKTVPSGWHFVSLAGPGAAYDESTGLIYVPVLIDNTDNNYQLLTVLGANGNASASAITVGIGFGDLAAVPPVVPTGNYCITALDANTGKQVWQFKYPTLGSGSVTAVNGVVYYGNWNGQIFALDGKSGKVLYFNNTTLPTFPFAVLGGAFSVTGGRLYVPVGIVNIPIPGGIYIFGLP